MLRGPFPSECEADLRKVEERLGRLAKDGMFSPAERQLESVYFGHWQAKLRSLLAKSNLWSDDRGSDIEGAREGALNHGEPSEESWRVITPDSLLRAILHIREDFERLSDARRDYHNEKCHKDLHPVKSGMIEPLVFKNHFYACIKELRDLVEHSFGRFFEISLNQSGLIGESPAHWAFLQVFDLIEREDRLVEGWVKSACDGSGDFEPATGKEFLEKVVFRSDWRAPQWLIMQPNGNRPYSRATAWERMDERDTSSTLRYLRENRWILLLKTTLDRNLGQANEALARRKQEPRPGTPGAGRGSSPKPDKCQPARPARPLMLKYRSGIKRAILMALSRNPSATDAEVCRALDANGDEDLPAGWKTRKEDRSFFVAYANPRTKRPIEVAISKVRRDLRDRGLLQ